MKYFYQTQRALPNTEEAGMQAVSRLISLLEHVSTDHVDSLGIGRSFTDANGLFWAVVRQNLTLHRLPAPGEDVRIATWPGKSSHGLFPRWYRMVSADGTLLLDGVFLWVLMDLSTREMIAPAVRGLKLPDFSLLRTEGLSGLSQEELSGIAETEEHFPSARSPKMLPEIFSADFTVPPDYIDRNGHMNNARYYDAVEGMIRKPDDRLHLSALRMEFSHEALLGEMIRIAFGKENQVFTAEGRLSEKLIFRMRLEYNT